MTGMTLDQFKRGFFDRKAVIDAVDRASLRVLSKFGAYVRRRARSSIRPRKAASRSGDPPSSHTGLLRDGIQFAYDRDARSLVVGAALLNSRDTANPVPGVLEHGGTAVVVRRVAGSPGPQSRRVTIAPRPFMQPAFEAERPNLDKFWADSITK